jgi:hypothetical protein
MHGGDKDHATGVSSLTNEEPLVVVKVSVDIMWEVIGKNCCNGSDGMIGKREISLCRSRHWFDRKGAPCAQDRDIGCRGSINCHWGSEVFSSRGGNINVVGVDGDVVMEWGKKESIKYFLSYAGGCRRHSR